MRLGTPALVLLLGGCTLISNFDFGFDDTDAGDRIDAGSIDAGDIDSGPPTDASGTDAGPRPDAAPGEDGGPAPVRCPSPCLGDATSDFAPASQGNGALDWRYHQDPGAALGIDFPELAYGVFAGLDAYGAAPEPPVIASCADNAAAAECAGLSQHLVVMSDPASSGAVSAISFAAPFRGAIRVQGRFRLPDGVSSAEAHRVTISRNARHDYATALSFIPTTTPTELDELIDVLQGDRVIVRFEQRSGATPVPLGVQLWVTRMGAPIEDRCVVGLTFDMPTPLHDHCGELDVDNLVDGIGSPPGPSTLTSGVSPWLGDGRAFVPGQYLRIGSAPADYSGDFTVQVWGYVNPGASFLQMFWADSSSDPPPGGVSMWMYNGQGYARTFHYRGGAPCVEVVPGVCILIADLGSITEGDWHFYRLVRSTADDEILVCVDGVRRARLAVDGSYDLTSAYQPHLGRNVDFNPAELDGRLDDARVFDVALPCAL